MARRVIYIMGEGRSGSTLLDLLLGNHPNVFGAGELWTFWANPSVAGNCSCGADFRECDFWRGVRKQFLKRTGDSTLGRSGTLRGRFDRARTLAVKWTRPAGNTRQLNRYEDDTRAIFDTLSELSGKPVAVDSTKQVGRAWNLLQIRGIDACVVHLVRDGRGVAWSRMRDTRRNSSLSPLGPVRSILNWNVKNALAMRIGDGAPGRYVLVRYEDLVSEPRRELGRIGALCGLNFDGVCDVLDKTGEFHAGHQIGGNVRARTGPGPKRLMRDEEWKSCLPARYDFLFRLMAGRVAARLGY